MAHIMAGLFRQEVDHEPRKGEVIHSGHFMISSVADPDDEDDVVSHDRDSPVHHDQAIRLREGYDFSDVRKETQNTYQFGHRSTNQITIDASLSRLFKCMSLAYQGGKVVSPKWKNFKGMRLSVKDKIRLNNAIWRTWHIQYIMRRRSKLSFVQFATPLDGESDCDSHSKPEAVVMEGKYWKRRIETVVAEYKKWRAFFMDKLQQSDHPGLTWVSHLSPSTTDSNVFDMLSKGGDDAVLMDFTDRLFSCLSQPFQFPNPREIAQHATNSDMMQPGLLQLQPMIEEFMDSDTLHDIFSPNRKSPSVNSASSLFYSESNMPAPQANGFSSMMQTQDMNTSAVQEVSLEELVQRATEQEANTMSIGHPGMNMQMLDTRQQDVPQMMQPQDMNLGVTDPVLGSVPGKVYGMPTPDHTVPPMMRSKQQQATPTISQVVTAHTSHHHNHGTTYEQSKVHAAMPPPQKKAPRRRSSGKSVNELVMGQAPMNVTLSPITVHQPMIQAQQQPLNNSVVGDVGVVDPTMSQMGQAVNRPVQIQPQQSAAIPCTLPQVVIIPENNFLQQTLDHKIVFTKSMGNTRNIQTRSQDVIINSMSANRQLNLNRRKEYQTVFVPVSVQQTIPNQGIPSGLTQASTLRHVPMDAMQVSGVAVLGKQPQPLPTHQGLPGQQTTLLTQLLTQERHAAPNRTVNNLQPPPNKSLIQTKQVQMRKVQEEAANLNDFQNSVVMAAAQMAHASQPQAKVGLQQQQPIVLPQLQNTTQSFVTAFSQVIPDKNTGGVALATPMDVNDSVKPFVPLRTPGSPTKRHAKEDQSSPLAKWQAVPAGSAAGIDLNDGGFPDRMISESFAAAIEATEKGQSSSSQKTSHSAGGSPASSTTSGTGDLRNTPFTAEQKRRCNIKALCDRLQEILPDVNSQPNSKVSKAVLLNKSCNYIKQLQAVRQQTSMEVQQLKKKIEALNEDISNIQQQLPVTGAPVSRHRGDRMRLVFEDWVRDRTLHNWKFYIFSMIIRSWFATYDQSVSVSNLEELCKTCLLWLEKYCALPSLRRSVVNSLQELSTTTSILSDPATLQQQAETAVKQNSRPSSSSSS